MTASINQKMSLVDIVTLIFLALIWGGSFFFVEVLVDYLPPLTIVTARVGIAACFLWAIMLLRQEPIPQNKTDWWALFWVALINNALPFLLIAWGQTQIDSGLASILNATVPFFTVILAGTLLADEKITMGKTLGVVVGLFGTIILIGPEALRGLSGSVLGQLACLGAALSYAVAAVFSRRFKSAGISPLMVATGQVSMATVMLLPFMLFIDQPWHLEWPPYYAIWALLGLAILCTVIAYIFYFRLIASAGATNAALVAYLIPISAIMLGVVVLGESFNLLEICGMALIATGLIITDGRIFRRIQREKQ